MMFYKLKFFGRYESDHPEDCEEKMIRNSHLSREDRSRRKNAGDRGDNIPGSKAYGKTG